MTLAANVPINAYVGNGSANTFAFTFPVFSQSHLLVTVTATATGVISTLVLGIDYTVTGLSPSGDPASTGNIVLVNASQAWLSVGNLATGFALTVQINIPLSQPTSLRNQGDFYRSALENALDTLAMQIQQQQIEIVTLQAGGTLIQPSTILTDTITGKTYQLQVVNGQFTVLELT